MFRRGILLACAALLALCLAAPRIGGADPSGSKSGDPAAIYYSFAPWDGAAYDLEIPQEPGKEGAKATIRISIWGNPEFPEPKTIRFTGREDSGGGPGKGDGIANYQAILNKSFPQRLAGWVAFQVLRKDQAVSGSYELKTLDGTRRFKGEFQAAWGNKPAKVIR